MEVVSFLSFEAKACEDLVPENVEAMAVTITGTVSLALALSLSLSLSLSLRSGPSCYYVCSAG